MKSRIHKCNPLNMHLGRATIAEGVSKQNSHPHVPNNIVRRCLFGLLSIVL